MLRERPPARFNHSEPKIRSKSASARAMIFARDIGVGDGGFAKDERALLRAQLFRRRGSVARALDQFV